jgi:hypothetical protein
MTHKPIPAAAEIVCSFKTVTTVPLSPFVWALLKALRTFASGARPSWDDFAAKLAVGEPSFFRAAWSELCDLQLADHDDFHAAELTDDGEVALESGFVRSGEPRSRLREKIYVRLNNGEPIRWRHDFEAKNHSTLFRPAWADSVTEKLVRKALDEQRESSDEQIDVSEKIYDLEIHWELSSRVKLD